jgi:hypothetical protein
MSPIAPRVPKSLADGSCGSSTAVSSVRLNTRVVPAGPTEMAVMAQLIASAAAEPERTAHQRSHIVLTR